MQEQNGLGLDMVPTSNHRQRRLRSILLVAVARLRFLVVLGAIGLVIVKWDELDARYEKWFRSVPSDTAAGSDTEYFCPMHPTVVRVTNHEKCPICFMPLSKRKKGDLTDDALPPGVVSRVQLSPYRVVLAGARTSPVGYLPMTRDIVAVGTVEFDERGLRAVAARVKGRIDKLFVNQTGQMVHEGDPLAELYSPDLVVTVQNLLDARAAGNDNLQRIARDRLRQWGIDDPQVEDIVRTGKPIARITIRSPITGHVLRKYPREGQYVEEGGQLFDVADLSTVWIQAQLYEEDLAFLPAGGHGRLSAKPAERIAVTATTRASPGRTFAGHLSFLFPHIDPDTRTLTVRFELPNLDHELRPGMSAAVVLKLTPSLLAGTPAGARLRTRDGSVLAIPEPSVIDTGRRTVVYRETLPNTFDGVLVELGARMTGPDGGIYYPILSGLAEGDKVVTAGSFLIDAETRLNPALGSVFIGGSGGKTGPSVRPSTPDDEEAKVVAALAKLSPGDRALAAEQKTCPILDGSLLGSMDVPLKLVLDGKPAFVCCKGCVKQATADSAKTLSRVAELRTGRSATKSPVLPQPASVPAATTEELAEIRDKLGRLIEEDRKLAETQKVCPVTGERLGSMGVPSKLMLQGKPVFVCCKTCVKKAQADPAGVLKKLSAKGGPP